MRCDNHHTSIHKMLKQLLHSCKIVRNGKCRLAAFWLLTSLAYAAVFLTIEFADNPAGSFAGFMALALQWALIAACSAGIIGLLVVNRYVMAATFTPLLIVSATLAYYRLSMGITLTPTIIELSLENNLSTAMTVVSPTLIVTILAATAVGVGATYLRFKKVADSSRSAIAIVVVGLALMSLQLIPRLKEPIAARLPYSLYHAVKGYQTMHRTALEHRDTYDNAMFTTSADSLTVIVVIGESLRPDHLQINGYNRHTTPSLMSHRANVISRPNVVSDYTHTYASIPHILTEKVDGNPDAAFDRQSFLTPLRKAGFHTAWISNQDEMQSYSYFMHEADTLIHNEPGKNVYVFSQNLDGSMLPHIRRIARQSARANQCMVIHCIGSHWVYTSHYPTDRAKFSPGVTSREVSANTPEQIVNSYDNTVVYTDWFINQLINLYEKKNCIIIYQSDHGEALGDNGQYLHGFDNPGVKKAASFIWYSDTYRDKNRAFIDSLRANASKRIDTTQTFSLVIESASVSSVRE